MKWLILVNETSGRRSGQTAIVERAAAREGVVADIVSPPDVDSMRQAVRQEAVAGRRNFAVAGGDGTISLVVDELMRCELSEPPVLAVLPTGSGSDFVRPFAIAQSVEGAMHHLSGTTDYPIDVGFVEGEWGTRAYVNVAQAGLLASTVAAASRYPRLVGGLKYPVAFWSTLPRFRPTEIQLTTDRRSYEGLALVMLAANGQFFGGGFNVAPKAALMDGILDVQVFNAQRRQALELFPKVRRGLHLRHKSVRRFRSRQFELTTAEPWLFEVDGDVLGVGPVRGWVDQGRLLLRI